MGREHGGQANFRVMRGITPSSHPTRGNPNTCKSVFQKLSWLNGFLYKRNKEGKDGTFQNLKSNSCTVILKAVSDLQYELDSSATNTAPCEILRQCDT